MRKQITGNVLWKPIFISLSAALLLVSLTGCAQSGRTEEAQRKQDGAKQGQAAADEQMKGDGSDVTDLTQDISADGISAGSHADTEGGQEAFRMDTADFAIALLQENAKEAEGNIMISPVSVLTALTMAANGAQEDTRSQMLSVLAANQDIDSLNGNLAAWLDGLYDGKDASVKKANSIWFNGNKDMFVVEEDFLKQNKAYYDADIYQAAFDESTVKEINRWVSDKTDGEIGEILDKIPEDAVMYLINATTFEAEWEEVYEKEDVRDGIFVNASGKEETVPMMYSSEHSYIADEMAVGFVKPYKAGYSFAAILPNEGISPEEYISGLDGEHFLAMLSAAGMEGIDKLRVCIPKFCAEYDVEMSEALKTMGMRDAFDMEKADFHGIGTAADNGNIAIDAVMHKTYIAVDELGTKAGAVSAVAMAAGAAEVEVTYVYLNRPFVYAIVENETNIPVFIGVVNTVNG